MRYGVFRFGSTPMRLHGPGSVPPVALASLSPHWRFLPDGGNTTLFQAVLLGVGLMTATWIPPAVPGIVVVTAPGVPLPVVDTRSAPVGSAARVTALLFWN